MREDITCGCRGLRRLQRFSLAIFLLIHIAAWPETSAAQSTPAAPQSFDVASVRVAKDCAGSSMSPQGARLFNLTHVSMVFLLGMAYKVGVDQIENKPGWADTTCYDVSARAEGDGSLGNDQLSRCCRIYWPRDFTLPRIAR